ncbi:hypothetical protein J4558_23145 [Leptolyngbya sp. 15MV]|nr:hypothetical protein J4558_23145 [Leptolyngbya sp. 15MV]
MMTLLCDHPRCRGMFVTIQREVADRLMAGPGSRDYGPISVVAQALAEVRRVASLPPECFWPRPEVHSAMVAVRRLERPMTDEARRLSAFCARAFGQRRKQLGSILGKAVAWPEGITPQNRIEELSVERVVALARAAG